MEQDGGGEELIFAKEVYAIFGAAIEVHREMGHGYLEPAYQECMEVECGRCGIPFEAQKELQLRYKGIILRKKYIPDLVCYDKIIVELKVCERLTGEHEGRILNYLHATGLRVGVLIQLRPSWPAGMETVRLVIRGRRQTRSPTKGHEDLPERR